MAKKIAAKKKKPTVADKQAWMEGYQAAVPPTPNYGVATPAEGRPSQFFTYHEVRCRHTGLYPADNAYLARHLAFMDRFRAAYGKPIYVASWYRHPTHPIEDKKPSGPGTHATGAACDLSLAPADVHRTLQALRAEAEQSDEDWLRECLDYLGWGVGAAGARCLTHLDTLGPGGKWSRPAVWPYVAGGP